MIAGSSRCNWWKIGRVLLQNGCFPDGKFGPAQGADRLDFQSRILRKGSEKDNIKNEDGLGSICLTANIRNQPQQP